MEVLPLDLVKRLSLLTALHSLHDPSGVDHGGCGHVDVARDDSSEARGTHRVHVELFAAPLPDPHRDHLSPTPRDDGCRQ